MKDAQHNTPSPVRGEMIFYCAELNEIMFYFGTVFNGEKLIHQWNADNTDIQIECKLENYEWIRIGTL